ncbi:hypothetical protein H7347_00085 [Corynebacterium sp. zg-331]|uniref:hypothetical protein n=1 Tax=unclassified Corynebacterium TaxID=2624378 RepID=UPI00128C3F3A|nr:MULTISPECIES: hypothetical protein [unclassified Corynebacterium]MBC3184998.1 hypothetical protein [Corynebacterium sp. zg-331]MPV51500.1 hypothetical protein [Corynebacterium sp. zg331]
MIRQHRRTAALVVFLGAAFLSACTIGEMERPGAGNATEETAVVTERPGPGTPVARERIVVPPGTSVAVADTSGVTTYGEADEGPAWSTSKVPLALAALCANPGVIDDVEKALTASDNEAAARLWQSLGAPQEAGAAVEAILREAGDDHTRVETRRVRPEFSSFGQTRWALPDQAAFAVVLPTLDGAQPVLEAMGRVIPEQSYGLGTIEAMRFKGGWGPDEWGRYTVRQFGLIETPCGIKGVAVAAQPPDGTYEGGQRLLTEVAQELAPALRC